MGHTQDEGEKSGLLEVDLATIDKFTLPLEAHLLSASTGNHASDQGRCELALPEDEAVLALPAGQFF